MVIPMVKQFSSSISFYFFFFFFFSEHSEREEREDKNWFKKLGKILDEMIFEKDELFNLIQ